MASDGRRTGLGRVSLGLFCAISAQAQTPNPEVRIRSGSYAFPQAAIFVQANLVESGVTVRDRSGVPVGGFTVNDFELFDNGKPQEVTFFAVQGDGRPAAAKVAQETGTQIESSPAP